MNAEAEEGLHRVLAFGRCEVSVIVVGMSGALAGPPDAGTELTLGEPTFDAALLVRVEGTTREARQLACPGAASAEAEGAEWFACVPEGQGAIEVAWSVAGNWISTPAGRVHPRRRGTVLGEHRFWFQDDGVLLRIPRGTREGTTLHQGHRVLTYSPDLDLASSTTVICVDFDEDGDLTEWALECVSPGRMLVIDGEAWDVTVAGATVRFTEEPVPEGAFGRGVPAPGEVLTTLDGASVTLGEPGPDVLILDFWGSWCGPCVAGIPTLKAGLETSEGIAVLGVAWNDRVVKVRAAVREHRIPWPQVVLDAEQEARMRESYRVVSFPTYVVIDRAGEVREVTDSADGALAAARALASAAPRGRAR